MFHLANQKKTQIQTVPKLPGTSDPNKIALPSTKIEPEDSNKRKREEDTSKVTVIDKL